MLLDEAQKIKNRDTELSHKCKLLLRHRAWALTGTPLENREDDLASVIEFVTPLEDGQRYPYYAPGSQLRERHRTIQLRRKKADVLKQLPPKIDSEILLSMTGEQRRIYDKAEREGIIQLKAGGESIQITNILTLILRLKQICNFMPANGCSVKMDDMLERLKILHTEGHRALVFSQFTDNNYGVKAIAQRLNDLNPLTYTGELSQAQRETVIHEFKQDNNHKALILSLRAGGQGLNLQDASYVFHFDRWWNPAVEHQAEDRTHRLGQVNSVHVYKYIIANTIEQRIDEILKHKQHLFDMLVDDVSIDISSALTAEELFGLFGLKAPEHIKRRQKKDHNVS